MKKVRLDQLVFNLGLAKSREQAQTYILAGDIFVSGQTITKPSYLTDPAAPVIVKEKFPYVSRGALKLEQAYKEFGLDFTGKTIADIGASTGGFTDFSLQHGAKKVYALDVGHGQLDQKLRQDTRVINLEKTNIRNVEALPEPVDFIVMDVSFISLTKVLPNIKKILQNQLPHAATVITLVKPQFEATKQEASKGKGVIKDPQIHERILESTKQFAHTLGFTVLNQTTSPIKGPAGNIEFLLSLKLTEF